MLVFKKHNGPTPVDDIAPQIITDCGNLNDDEWCIYIAFYCVLLYPQSTLQSRGGGGGLSSTTTSVQHPLGWCDGCHRTTAPLRSPHTSYRWRGERVIEPIKWMGIIRRLWMMRASGGICPGHWGYTPTLYEKCHGIFNDHESQDLGLTSHPKTDNLTLDFKQLGLWASPPFIQTLGPWFPNEIQNFLSSEKRTLDHWATVQFFSSLDQVRCLWRQL